MQSSKEATLLIVLKWISEQAEKDFREFTKNLYDDKKGNEKHAFQDLMEFIKSDFGQESFKKWKINESQKDPRY